MVTLIHQPHLSETTRGFMKDELLAAYSKIDALIKALTEAAEWANMDDPNGEAGDIARRALTQHVSKESKDG